MLEAPTKASVMGLPIHLSENYLGWLTDRLGHHQGTHVVTLNSEMVMLAEHNEDLAQAIQKADLVIPDGSGVIFYLRLRGKFQQRCPGIELAETLLQQAGQQRKNCPIFFYGGAPDIAQEAAKNLTERIPGLSITTEHGYLSQEGEQHLLKTLKRQQPHLILVGLGVPRQELWIRQHRSLCPHATWIGVGGSFDIWAGMKTRAPGWLRNNNLEWLYRLYQEPWRWRRMLVLPQFALRALTES